VENHHHGQEENVGAAIVSDVAAMETDGGAENVLHVPETGVGSENDDGATEICDDRLQILDAAEIFP